MLRLEARVQNFSLMTTQYLILTVGTSLRLTCILVQLLAGIRNYYTDKSYAATRGPSSDAESQILLNQIDMRLRKVVMCLGGEISV